MLNSAWINSSSLNQASLGQQVLFEASFSSSALLSGGMIRRAGVFSNAAAGVTGSGELQSPVALAGVATGQAMAFGTLNYTTQFGGAATATAVFDGRSMYPSKPLAGVLSGTAAFFGDMSRDALYSSFSGVATLTGTIDPKRFCSGTAVATASLNAADFFTYGLLGSSFAGAADFFGELSANSNISMSGTLSATATLTLSGSEWVSVPLAGAFGASATLLGEATIWRAMQPEPAAAGAIAVGGLGRRARLDATPAASASASGSVTKRRVLGGSAMAQALGHGVMRRRATFAGTTSATANLTGTGVWYSATGSEFSARATGLGSLFARTSLAASASVSATLSAALLPNPGTLPPNERTVTAVFDGSDVEALFESMTVQVM